LDTWCNSNLVKIVQDDFEKIGENMTRCGTYMMPDLEMTKEENINNLVRILNDIKPLLKKYETMENNEYQNANEVMSKDNFDKMMDYMGENPSDLAQEVLDRGHAATYENDDGLVVKEYPDGRIFHIDVDLKTGETIYLKQLK